MFSRWNLHLKKKKVVNIKGGLPGGRGGSEKRENMIQVHPMHI
jgi:hypothetical protein